MAVIGSHLYSFRYTTGVFTPVFQPALAAIEAKLTEGHADFLASRYQPAKDAYNQAASLIYGQLHAQALPCALALYSMARNPSKPDPCQ